MFPVNASECLKQLKTFNPLKEEEDDKEDDDLTLPLLKTLTKPMQIEVRLYNKWEKKFTENLSSPSRLEGLKIMKGTKQCLIDAQLQQQELAIVQSRRIEDLERKVTKRGLTANDAQRKIDAIKQKAKEAIEKKEKANFLKLWRAERDEAYREGVKARASERTRRKRVKELLKAKQDIPTELLHPIPDPEAIWKAGQEEIKYRRPYNGSSSKRRRRRRRLQF
jgi:hypothetical protein